MWIKPQQTANLVTRFVFSFVFFLACSPGTWKIMAKFSNKPQSQFAAEFEVKEFGESNLKQTMAAASFLGWLISFCNLSSDAQSVSKTDPRALVLLRGWRQTHREHCG